jgi:hypothetical protein
VPILWALFDEAGCSEEERRLIAFENTAAVFGFDADDLLPSKTAVTGPDSPGLAGP